MIRFAIRLGITFGVCIFAARVHATSCEQYYTSTTGAPIGYAAPYDTLTATHPLLTSADCTPTNVLLTVGAQNTTEQQVYKFAYLFASDGLGWQQITLSSVNTLSGSWYSKQATATLTLTAAQQQDWNYIAFLVSHWTGTKWVSGCNDTSCVTPKWSLQAIAAVAVVAPSSMILNNVVSSLSDTSRGGTLIATADVTMSDGTKCQGPPQCSLTSSLPNLFAIQDLNVILARSLSAADDGSYTVTITAN